MERVFGGRMARTKETEYRIQETAWPLAAEAAISIQQETSKENIEQ